MKAHGLPSREEVYQTMLYLLRSRNEGELGHLLDTDFAVINGLLGLIMESRM